jgi:hypothetical protein
MIKYVMNGKIVGIYIMSDLMIFLKIVNQLDHKYQMKIS